MGRYQRNRNYRWRSSYYRRPWYNNPWWWYNNPPQWQRSNQDERAIGPMVILAIIMVWEGLKNLL